MKRIINFLSVCFLSLGLVACGGNLSSNATTTGSGWSSYTSSVSTSTSVVTSTSVEYKEAYSETSYDETSAVKISLNESSVSVDGEGVAIDGSIVTINNIGVYVVSGTLNDGQLIVDCSVKGNVRIILDGATIKCSNSAAIFVKEAKKTIITLKEGTINKLIDGETYLLNEDEEPTATLFAKDNLILNGTGTLTIEANYNDGITSKDDLYIMSGTYKITSKDDGIVGKDLLAIKDGEFNINAGGDAMKSSNDSDEGAGVVSIEGGTFNLTATADGIQAESLLQISNGNFIVTTGGGSINASTNNSNGGMWGGWGGYPWGSASSSTTATSDSAKGLKATKNVLLIGGTFILDTSDDAIHSNGNVEMDGGKYSIASGDDGIHADDQTIIDGGEITITKSYEGIEGNSVTINNGTISVVASDDGINSAGGSDTSEPTRPGMNHFINDGSSHIYFNGGIITINASGDGIDANGSVYINGGTIYISGPTSGGDSALDYDGTCLIKGGTLVAVGSIGMVQAPSNTSTVYGFNLTFAARQGANKLLEIKDNNGETLISFTPNKEYQSLVLSSQLLAKDETISVYVDGNKYTSIKLSSIVTNAGNTTAQPGGNLPPSR